MMQIAGEIMIILGLVFMSFGVIGLFKFPSFYPRILIASKIDTVGMITILLGVTVRNGLSFFSLRVLLILGLILIVNPMVTHIIARFAYLSGYKPKSDKIEHVDHTTTKDQTP